MVQDDPQTPGAPSPMDVLLAGTRRNTQALLWIATATEVIAAVSSIVTKMPAWLVSALLAGVPLSTIAWHNYRKSRFLAAQLQMLYTFRRRYLVHYTRDVYRQSPKDGYWAASRTVERRFVALKPNRHFTWSILRRADIDIPFAADGLTPTVQNTRARRSGHGTCTFHPPHKIGTTLSFRVEFEPPLRPNEEAEVFCVVDLPLYKAGSLDTLRQRPTSAVPTVGDAEFTSIDISYPIEDFRFEAVIPEAIGSRRHGLQALAGDNEAVEEMQLLEAGGGFAVERVDWDGAPAWTMKLHRQRPPLRSTYRLYWQPPDSGRQRTDATPAGSDQQ